MGGIRQDVKRLKNWDFYTLFFGLSYIFVALMKITMSFKQLEASNIMSWAS